MAKRSNAILLLVAALGIGAVAFMLLRKNSQANEPAPPSGGHAPPSVGTLSGRVVDTNNLFMVGVTVQADGQSTKTDSTGWYTIRLPVGSYTVSVSTTANIFTAPPQTVVVQANQTTLANFTMSTRFG